MRNRLSCACALLALAGSISSDSAYAEDGTPMIRRVNGHPIASKVRLHRADATSAEATSSCLLEDGGLFLRGYIEIDGTRVVFSDSVDPAFGFYVPPNGAPSGPGSCEETFVMIAIDAVASAFKQ